MLTDKDKVWIGEEPIDDKEPFAHEGDELGFTGGDKPGTPKVATLIMSSRLTSSFDSPFRSTRWIGEELSPCESASRPPHFSGTPHNERVPV